ncbi:polysaccharide deacetylase family protein [Salegentibacter sediminis]|uniref:polysaccharide deacetylase family protein n=1 Tax=Salegentibacter sediminis TaxID=1930251 RepID=UPI0009BEC9A3|nr:polysaccharide deacetylase family protein [Salegentibacter sediminis]
MLFINGVRVLAYHKVSAKENFRSQIKFLVKYFKIISIFDLYDNIYLDKELPKNSVLLTFDDGDYSIYQNAMPILKEFNIPAVIFVITDLINTNKPFWWDEIKYYLGETEGERMVWEVKKWDNFERKRFLEKIRKDSCLPNKNIKQLSNHELKEMSDAGITIANHSHSHPMFDKVSDLELNKELSMAIDKLKSLKFSPFFFAYPNGNFTIKSENKLKELGIQLAFLFDHKINRNKLNPLRISRLRLNDHTPKWKLIFILSGLHTKLLPFIKAVNKIK